MRLYINLPGPFSVSTNLTARSHRSRTVYGICGIQHRTMHNAMRCRSCAAAYEAEVAHAATVQAQWDALPVQDKQAHWAAHHAAQRRKTRALIGVFLVAFIAAGIYAMLVSQGMIQPVQ